MWDLKQVKLLDLKKNFSEQKLQTLYFQIDPEDPESFIKEVRTGSNPDLIVIIVQQTKDLDSIISWDIDNNTEFSCNDIEEEYLVIWDSRGLPYIATSEKIIFCSNNCALKAFSYEIDFETVNSLKDLTFHKGHRLDGKNHNWIIFQEYLSLPFSYMSFVIKEKIESKDECLKGNIFDIEPYNYLFNKSTTFMDGEFVATDPNEILAVLSKFEEIDIDLLEVLHYTTNLENGDQQSALHKAIRYGNNRSIEIILGFMAKIHTNASSNFKSIIGDLIEYKSFVPYLEALPHQSR